MPQATLYERIISTPWFFLFYTYKLDNIVVVSNVNLQGARLGYFLGPVLFLSLEQELLAWPHARPELWDLVILSCLRHRGANSWQQQAK